MTRRQYATLVAAICLIQSAAIAADAPAPARQATSADGPAARQWTAREGVLELKAASVGCSGGKDSPLKDIASKLVPAAVRLGLGNWVVTEKLDANIWLKVGEIAESKAPDAYTLEIGSTVVITGNSPSGVLNGVRTLLEMLAKDKTRLTLPRGTLVAMPPAVAAAPTTPAAAPSAATNAAQVTATTVPPATTPLDAAFTVPPYLQDLRTNEVTVMWWTTAGAYGWVEFGETEALGKIADTANDGMREVTVARHAVRLRGLTPGTRYWYRAGVRSIISYKKNSVRWTGDIFSPVYSFTTPSPQDARVRCVIMNDTQNDLSFAPLLALPGVKPYDFSIFNGDCFAEIQNGQVALPLLRSYTAAVEGSSKPAVFVRGNGELRNSYATLLRNLFTYPNDRSYFAFTRGPVRFLVLDCGADKPDADPSHGGTVDFSAFRTEVRDWLAGEIASGEFRQARWRVLIHHIPLYGPGACEQAQPFYLPVLSKAPFDLAINGYTHQAAALKRGAYRNPYPVVTGGGSGAAATLTLLDATTTGWSVKVVNLAGKVLVSERGGQ